MLRTFYSEALSSRQLGGLSRLDDAVLNRRRECVMYGVTQEEVQPIINAYINERPESYFCALQFIRLTSDADCSRLELLYNESCDEGLFSRRFEEITAELDRHITPYTSEYEVAKRVYDYLAKNVKVAFEVQNNFAEVQRSGEYDEYVQQHGNAFTAYGALVDGEAVCMGFSMAYRMLLTHYGLDVACVPGFVDDLPHMINAVAIGDERAYVDLTYGVLLDGLPLVRYDRFLVPAEDISCFRTDYDLACNSRGIDFFTQSRLLFRDLRSLRRYLDAYIYSATGGEIRFRYTGGAFNDDRLHDIAGEVLARHCGYGYRMGNAIVNGGIGSFQMLKN